MTLRSDETKTPKARRELFDELVARHNEAAQGIEDEEFRYPGTKVRDFIFEKGWVQQAERSGPETGYHYYGRIRLSRFECIVLEIEAELAEYRRYWSQLGSWLLYEMPVWRLSDLFYNGMLVTLALALGAEKTDSPGYSSDTHYWIASSNSSEHSNVYVRFPNPEAQAKFRSIAALLKDACEARYREGVEWGTNLLGQLAMGEISPGQFSDKVVDQRRYHQGQAFYR